MVAMTAEALAPTTGDGYDVVPLVERLRSRQDRFAEDAQQAVLAQVAGYRALDTPGLRLEVEANCAQVFGIFLDTLAAGRVPTPADFPATAGYGARRIRVGISLEDFLKAYRVGQALLWDHVRAAADGLPGGSVAALTVVGTRDGHDRGGQQRRRPGLPRGGEPAHHGRGARRAGPVGGPAGGAYPPGGGTDRGARRRRPHPGQPRAGRDRAAARPE